MDRELIENFSGNFVHEGLYYPLWLKGAAELLGSSLYLEIGTYSGESLRSINCAAVCIHPHFTVTGDILQGRRETHFIQATPDDFFADRAAAARLFHAGVDLAFLHGVHLYEARLRDFIYAERQATSSSMIVLQDCLPLNERMAERERRLGGANEPEAIRDFWTGDVWKLAPILAKYRPDLTLSYVDCGPTGLLVCTCLDPENRMLSNSYEEIVSEFDGLRLGFYGLERLWRLCPRFRSSQLISDKDIFSSALYRHRSASQDTHASVRNESDRAGISAVTNRDIADAPEAVRLVVWDLDDTFWTGTVTEGGIRHYIDAHHDIVIELARRGIMSSVCSKNDAATILPILERMGIRDYFILPDISWDPKGPRLAALIEAVQLRPATVMFIDDNPRNRAEAVAAVPGLQVEDETFLSRLLSDHRFRGKDDHAFSRLAQYKLLEKRNHDKTSAPDGNAAFLRSCDVRVYVEYDVLSHIDRAVELINRTNQLNFTKRRLPEDIGMARHILAGRLAGAGCQAGLIRVVDTYGDYGFVGFFMLENGRKDLLADVAGQTLVHYCFSCRTLGMLVEHWFYHWLRRPELTVVGEVLTDLTTPQRIDWIRMVPSLSEDAPGSFELMPQIRIHGGCEANAVAHYLGAYGKTVAVTGNFAAGALFIRQNSASLLLSACSHAKEAIAQEAASLGIPAALIPTGYFDDPPHGTVFVFSGGMDAGGIEQYRHKISGWEIRLELNGSGLLNFVSASDEEISQIEHMSFSDGEKERVLSAAGYIRQNYESIWRGAGEALPSMMRSLFDRVPVGSKLIIILDAERARAADGEVATVPWVVHYNAQIKSIVQTFPFVAVVSCADVIEHDDEIQMGGNHYDRMVYWRLAEAIVAASRNLPAKTIEAAMAA